MIRKYAEIFCWKNVSSFCNAKATHIFSANNIRFLCIESAKTVNKMTLNELVKLTTLWTTRPWFFVGKNCQTLLSQKLKKIYFKMSSADFFPTRWASKCHLLMIISSTIQLRITEISCPTEIISYGVFCTYVDCRRMDVDWWLCLEVAHVQECWGSVNWVPEILKPNHLVNWNTKTKQKFTYTSCTL